MENDDSVFAAALLDADDGDIVGLPVGIRRVRSTALGGAIVHAARPSWRCARQRA